MIDDEIIMDYFGLSKRIKKKEGCIKMMRYEFYQQTMSSYCTSDELKTYSKGFAVDWNVISLVDSESATLEQISLLRFKRKHFLRYLRQLPKGDRHFLTKKYKWHQGGINERLERECLEELQEIEEAAGYRFGGYEPHIQLEEIEEVTSETYGESLENSFDKMMAMLGVSNS